MALSIDSQTVLRTFADHPQLYPAIQGDLADFARKALVKQLKSKSTTAALLRQIHDAVSFETLAVVIDGMSAAEIVALAKKVDLYSDHAKSGSDTHAARAHLHAIAAGRAEPAVKPEKATTAKTPKARTTPPSKIGAVLGSKVHSGAARKPRTP